MPQIKHISTKHECDLDQREVNVLPRIAPFAPAYKKWFYRLRRWFIISRSNPNSKMYFRSEFTIFKEKRRQVGDKRYHLIIHPFSRFCIAREMFICFMWMIAFFLDPYCGAFRSKFVGNKVSFEGSIIQCLLNVFFLLDMIVNFFMGYTIDRTKEIILEHNRIIKHYLKTYFVFDFVPTVYGIVLFFCRDLEVHTKMCIAQLYWLRFVRLKTMLTYMSHMLSYFRFRESIVRCVTITLYSIFLVHWWACGLYLIPTIQYYITNMAANSWVISATVGTNRSTFNIYVECLLCTVCHFFGAGKGSIKTQNSTEQLILSLMVMCGVTCHIYVIAVILQLFGTINVSESKYEELIYQLNEYMVTKKLPQKLRKRLFMYYDYRFQKQFFLEDIILSSLSEHLRYEVLLYSCRNLIEKVRIFQGASKAVIGTMISMLRHEIFLPDDIIIKPDTINEYVYFISFGTCSVYLPNGREVVHLEDGHHFGEVHIILQNVGEKSFTTVIAIEITEVFYLNKKDFLYCVAAHPEIVERLEKVAISRLNVYREKMDTAVETIDTMDILAELRRGKILEQGRHRY